MKKMLFPAVLFFLGFFLWFAFEWERFLTAPVLSNSQGVTIKIPSGESAYKIVSQITQQAALRHPVFLMMFFHFSSRSFEIKSGEYYIDPPLTPTGLMDHFVQGKVVKHTFKIIEGWTFSQIKQALENEPSLVHLTHGWPDARIIQQWKPALKSPEGMFFPDTYYYIWGNSDLDLLRRAYDRLRSILSVEWQQRAASLPYATPYTALIVASMVEKEAMLAEERALISGVIKRRLQKGMRLQIDPTVYYGLGKSYEQRLTRQDLETDTAYNTYLRRGLPPTPIDTPGQASIHAALHPDDSEHLYFVAKGQKAHQFSSTYRDHQEAVRKYRLKPG